MNFAFSTRPKREASPRASLSIRRLLCGGITFLFWQLTLLMTHAQWTMQTIQLRPGWNAVYLEVEPEPIECDSLFSGLPVESVWAWNKRFSSVQFIQDPDELVPGQPDWLTWLPASHTAETFVNLFTIRGAAPYLIKLRDTAAPMSWTIRGRPRIREVDWISDSYNLVGFPLAQANPPNYQTFFSGSPAHAGKPIYRLNPSGLWEQVSNPASTPMRPGEAFWIRCDGPSTYSGPIWLTVPGGRELNYGRQLAELTLRFKNLSASTRTLTLRTLPSDVLPGGPWPTVAGIVPLSYFRMNLASNEYGWLPLTGQLLSKPLPPGGEWMIRLEARRRDMTFFAGPVGANGATYQTMLELQDGAGFRQLIGVTAEGLTYAAARPGSLLQAASVANGPHPYAGLWVGHAIIEKVSQPSHVSQPDTPLPVATPLQYRILIHVDAQGQARLLQRVLQMWKNGTLKPDPDDPSRQIVDEPGRFVLVTDERLIPNFSGATLRDGQPVGRRLSTVAYALQNPLPLTGQGSFGAGDSVITGTLSLDYDDPVNPFKHRYHPDHDNLDDRFSRALPEGQESFTIHRELMFQFTATDPDGLAIAGWGDNQLGGICREKMEGAHARPIFMEGTFRLQQAARVPVLNDGL